MKKGCEFKDLVAFIESYKRHLSDPSFVTDHKDEIATLEKILVFAKNLKEE